MKVSFYEEFPTMKNLGKVKLISFPSNLIVASKSVDGFKKLRKKIRKCGNGNVEEIIYWPVLEKNDGYWLSPFTKRKALQETISDIRNNAPISVMWDAELPMIKPGLLVTELPNHIRNRNMIKDFFKNSKSDKIGVYTSEYPLRSSFWRKTLCDLFLLSFNPGVFGNRKIAMFYTSLFKKHPNIERLLEEQVRIGQKRYGKDFLVGLGCITTGVLGNEPTLAPAELDRDLKVVKKMGVEEAVVFRLGGLNSEFAKIISKHAE